jgi:hypothetical protein
MGFHVLKATLSWDEKGECTYTPTKTTKTEVKDMAKNEDLLDRITGFLKANGCTMNDVRDRLKRMTAEDLIKLDSAIGRTGSGVPEPPRMKWTADGKPCFAHLTEPDPVVEALRANRQAQAVAQRQAEFQTGVPEVPKMQWKRSADGKNYEADFSQFNKE